MLMLLLLLLAPRPAREADLVVVMEAEGSRRAAGRAREVLAL